MSKSSAKRFKPFSTPARTLVVGFFSIITIGAVLLSMPFSSADGTFSNLIDCFFTATSATCVTGLVVYETASHWSPIGKTIIILLIQVGGLGFMSIFTMFLVIAGKKITLKERILIQTSLNQKDVSGMVKFVKRAIIGSLFLEGIAAFILTIRFMFDGLGFTKSLLFGIFHSISAFCNAGFDIIGSISLSDYVADPTMNIVISSLIVIGGLGFTVWFDLINFFKKLFKEKKRLRESLLSNLSLHSKLVLLYTLILLIGGALLFFLFEHSNKGTIGNLSFTGKTFASFFQSVTVRTAGYYSIPQQNLTFGSQFLSVILMFIGGSPAGTAGGMKTVTLGIIIAAVASGIKGKSSISLFNKSLSFETLQKALTVMAMMLTVVITSTILLTITERNTPYEHQFMDLLFETTSGAATVGLTMGITPFLTYAGKIIIILCMFLGRLGPITVVVALSSKQSSNLDKVKLPEEKVIIG